MTASGVKESGGKIILMSGYCRQLVGVWHATISGAAPLAGKGSGSKKFSNFSTNGREIKIAKGKEA